MTTYILVRAHLTSIGVPCTVRTGRHEESAHLLLRPDGDIWRASQTVGGGGLLTLATRDVRVRLSPEAWAAVLYEHLRACSPQLPQYAAGAVVQAMIESELDPGAFWRDLRRVLVRRGVLPRGERRVGAAEAWLRRALRADDEIRRDVVYERMIFLVYP